MSKSAKASADKFMAEFEKMFGAGTLKSATRPQYETLSTGSVGLDKAMGAGGFVRGRITEVWGPPSGGKSSLTLISAGLAQRETGRRVAYIDVERTFDGAWASTLGVDLDELDVVEPVTAEDVADMVKMLTSSERYAMVILDSVGAMTAMKEFEKNADEATVGLVAKIVTRMVKIATHNIQTNNIALVVINQVRDNIGGYGVTETTGGGHALEHSLTHKLQVKRGSAPYTVGTNEDKRNVGYEMVVKVQKSKVCPEGRMARFGFFTESTEKYGPVGIDKIQEAFTVAKNNGVIAQGGAWYTFPDGERVQGSEAALDRLRTNPDLLVEIRNAVLKSVEHELILIEDE